MRNRRMNKIWVFFYSLSKRRWTNKGQQHMWLPFWKRLYFTFPKTTAQSHVPMAKSFFQWPSGYLGEGRWWRMAKPLMSEEIPMMWYLRITHYQHWRCRNLLELHILRPYSRPANLQTVVLGLAGRSYLENRLGLSFQFHGSLKGTISNNIYTKKLANTNHIFKSIYTREFGKCISPLFFQRVVKQLSEHHLTQKSLF